jgi:hypothetical protein
MAGFFRGNSRSEFRTHWGSGAKELRAGIYSDKCQVLLGLYLSSEAAKIFQAASVAR